MRTRLLSTAVVCMAACTSATDRDGAVSEPRDAQSQATGKESVAVRQLLQEYYSGLTDSSRIVITDRNVLETTWARVFERRSEAPPVPTVDFAAEMVVVASMGTRNSGGHTIQIDSARYSAGELQVFVQSLSPGPVCGTTAALTQPVAIVAVPRTAQSPRFVETARRVDC